MEFYCPKCQQVVNQDSEKIETTRANRQVAIAHCQVCNQELAAYGVEPETEATANV